MFSRATDASKIALVHLAARLIAGGYTLLDAQFHNPHLEQFGLIEIPRAEFKARLRTALTVEGNFYSGVGSVSSDGGSSSIIGSSDGAVLRSGSFTGSVAVQRITQTS